MFTLAASPQFSSLIAPLGAKGGALAGGTVSGWAAVVWLLQLLRSYDLPAAQGRPWAVVWAILARIVSGDVRLRGCVVTVWTQRRGLERVECVRIRVGSDATGTDDSSGFTLTVRLVYTEPVEIVRGELSFARLYADAISGWRFASDDLAKRALSGRETHAYFVTVSY